MVSNAASGRSSTGPTMRRSRCWVRSANPSGSCGVQVENDVAMGVVGGHQSRRFKPRQTSPGGSPCWPFSPALKWIARGLAQIRTAGLCVPDLTSRLGFPSQRANKSHFQGFKLQYAVN
jgi:hypothetical protein